MKDPFLHISSLSLIVPGFICLCVRIGHVTSSSRVLLYDFGSYMLIQLAVVLRTSVVAIRCLRHSLGVLGVPPSSFINSNNKLA